MLFLGDLPPEVILCITDHISKFKDFNAFVRSNSNLYALLNPCLYRRDAKRALRLPHLFDPHPTWPGFSCYTALTWAAEHGVCKTAWRSLEAGLSTEILLPSFITPLTLAAYHGHLDIVQLLLDRGANVNCRSPAIVGRSGAIVPKAAGRLLLRPRGCGFINDTPHNPLFAAACRNHAEIVRLLLQSGRVANVNDCGSVVGYTPLQAAACSHAPTIVRLLLDHGADVNRGNPLLLAVWSENRDVVRELLKQDDIDVNAADSWGRTPLLETAQCGDARMTKLLLSDPRVDVNHIGGPQRCSALALAACFGYPRVVRHLLTHKDIDVNTLFFAPRPSIIYSHALICTNAATARELFSHENVRVALASENGKEVLRLAVKNENMGGCAYGSCA